jgi:8-oxo-dGTP pyrophosphatase MutT (NUDIX family)
VRVIGLRKLKGVWENRHYPLTLYHHDWTNLRQSFAYDDAEESPTIKEALDRADNADAELPIDVVVDQAGRGRRVAAMIRAIEGAAAREPVVHGAVDDQLEVHCVAVCFDERDRVLVGRRPASKRIEPGKWEFGCARLRAGQTFEDAIQADYLGDFGLEVEAMTSRPLETYAFKKASKNVPGIVFAARAKNAAAARDRFNAAKHTEVRWIHLDEARALDAASACVPGFLVTLERALELVQQGSLKK